MIKIKEAKLSARTLKVKFVEHKATDAGMITNVIDEKCGNLVHEDMITAMNRLKIHFALLCEFREVSHLPEFFDIESYIAGEELDRVFITGIVIGGSDSVENITVCGGKYTKHNAISLSAPAVSSDSSDYPHVSNLFEVVENIKSEIEQYLFNGKCAVKQAELDFGVEAAAEDSVEAAMDQIAEKPKRGRKKNEPKTTIQLAS